MPEASGLSETLTTPLTGILARATALKSKLRDGGTIIGGWLTIADPAVAEIMGRIGLDYLMVDSEHSPFDLQTLQSMLMALQGSRTVPMIRAAWNDHVRIKQLLDMGFEGILAPMVRTTQECRDLVSACRYPPGGTRGFGPKRASNYYADIDAYVATANDAIFVMPQIEHIDTVEILDDYLSVPGIDAVAIGPNDLSGSAGVTPPDQPPDDQAGARHDPAKSGGARCARLPRRQYAGYGEQGLGRARCPDPDGDVRSGAPRRRRFGGVAGDAGGDCSVGQVAIRPEDLPSGLLRQELRR